MEYKAIRAIISGGGTGGHIFPAISIADSLMKANPKNRILFVGAEGRMEMDKVPATGYEIVGLKISGLDRKLNLKNAVNAAKLPFKVADSVREAGRVIRDFRPDIVIGVGGYASAPLLWKAQNMGIPTLIQEQNGFAGLTNKILSRRADRICVAYEGMDKFFPKDKIIITGNPIRPGIIPATPEMKAEGLRFYNLDPKKKHMLVIGGSLGSGTLNSAMRSWIENGCPGGEDVEVLWQCGKYYKAATDLFMAGHLECDNVRHFDFITRMDLAYATADVVISRSGASSISELCAAHKAAIFVPSPNVAEDHQTHNAMALVNKGAGLMVKDSDAVQELLPVAMELIHDSGRIKALEDNAGAMAKTSAADTIADEAYKLLGNV